MGYKFSTSGIKSETIDFSDKVTILSEEVIYENFVKNIIIDKIWDSHGREVDFGMEMYKNVFVKVIERKERFDFGDSQTTFTTWYLSIDDKSFGGEVSKIKGTKNAVRVKVVVGSG